MLLLVREGINKGCFILLVFEKFTHAYLFQIALKIMWLSIQTT